MKLAVSNIAWPPEEDAAVATVLHDLGISAIEVAPTLIWPRPLDVSAAEAAAYRKGWERRGIRIVAMQSLLFGRPELVLFGAESARRDLQDYLRGVFRLASWLGAGPLVFGSPQNRLRGSLAPEQSQRLAREFFSVAGAAAAAAGVVLCLEPNPVEYGCDFVNTLSQARKLVTEVASAGFQLQADSGAMRLAGESAAELLSGAPPCHYHISEPFLRPIGHSGVDHRSLAATLQRLKYSGYCSVEMRAPSPPGLETLAAALRVAAESYRISEETDPRG